MRMLNTILFVRKVTFSATVYVCGMGWHKFASVAPQLFATKRKMAPGEGSLNRKVEGEEEKGKKANRKSIKFVPSTGRRAVA